jgi:hypothetical protein
LLVGTPSECPTNDADTILFASDGTLFLCQSSFSATMFTAAYDITPPVIFNRRKETIENFMAMMERACLDQKRNFILKYLEDVIKDINHEYIP